MGTYQGTESYGGGQRGKHNGASYLPDHCREVLAGFLTPAEHNVNAVINADADNQRQHNEIGVVE
jgi:hypothetical protein